MESDGEVIQRQHFCHHGDTICHPASDFSFSSENAFASGALHRTPLQGLTQRPRPPQLVNVGSYPCRVPHRIAGPRAPRPHDPPLATVAKLPCVLSQNEESQCVLVAAEYHQQLLAVGEAIMPDPLTELTVGWQSQEDGIKNKDLFIFPVVVNMG